jgi:glycosyltransferase involved in cell wall biosynthesis
VSVPSTTTPPRLLAALIDHRGQHRRTALRERISTIIATLDAPPPPKLPTSQLLDRLANVLREPSEDRLWLSLAVIGGELPDQAAVQRATRAAQLDGPLSALLGVLSAPRLGWPLARGPWPRVRVVTGRVLVDVHHTAQTDLATGIQRVARQATLRWHRDHEPLLLGWTPNYTAVRELDPDEQARALFGSPPDGEAHQLPRTGEIVVPWECTYVLPELLTEPVRARSLLSMLRFSRCQGAMIGFDCVPLTSAETTADGMGGGFAMMLSAMAYGDRIATISASAAAEYRGWRTMLSGAGLPGPDITPIALPVEAQDPSDGALAEARDLLLAGQLPMVLCVGSHEPRKNHLAVLHAAELLWREGLAFSLIFVGGNAWRSERFVGRLNELQSAGRPVESVHALSDELLWAAYRLARCVIFPSLNEGFGLPVAESLASGTPVITSGFGSMQEIAAEGGALLVDPRDDRDITAALRRLITDDSLHARLSAEARAHPTRTWEGYAADTWAYLVGDHQAAQPGEQLAAART